MNKFKIVFVLLLSISLSTQAQLLDNVKSFSRADSLRGGIGPGRTCYDVSYYHLDIKVDPKTKTIKGNNLIRYTIMENFKKMQIDLFANLKIEKIIGMGGRELNFTREFNAVFVNFPIAQQAGSSGEIKVYYSGTPIEAKNAPWDGGFVWSKDKDNKPWVGVACQGTGASLWWPNKDHQYDEPDSMMISIAVPSDLMNISNGRLRNTKKLNDGFTRYSWAVTYPINNYDVTLNIGKFDRFSDSYKSISGKDLTLDYFVLTKNREKAEKQFTQVKPMMACLEKYLGPYPFQRDGYKLIESPYLGMEHQSAVAYGNGYQNGYKGYDRSGSGYGEKFDYIIIHESAHEWWGNNVTARDIADMWIQEGFCTYSEALYVECMYGYEAAISYLNGKKKSLVKNQEPIQGTYGLNNEGSSDMYNKGSLMLNTLRSTINNDSIWFSLLRGIQQNFGYKTVSAKELFSYINKITNTDYFWFYKQYVTRANIPVLEIKTKEENGKTLLNYRWASGLDEDFILPLIVQTGESSSEWIYPANNWQTKEFDGKKAKELMIADKLFYVEVKEVED